MVQVYNDIGDSKRPSKQSWAGQIVCRFLKAGLPIETLEIYGDCKGVLPVVGVSGETPK